MTKSPIGPSGIPVLGNTLAYDRDRIDFVMRCQKRYGDVFRYSKSSTFILEPELAHDVLMRTDQEFVEPAVVPGAPPLSAMPAGRHASGAQLRRKAVRHWAKPLLGRFRDTLDASLNTQRPLDVYSLMGEFTAGAAMEFCLGEACPGDREALERLVDTVDVVTASSLTYPRWLPVPAVRRAHRADHALRSLLRDRVREARRGSAHDAGLVYLLASRGGMPGSDESIASFLNSLLRAARNEPAVTLTWAMRMLATSPRLKEVIADEARGLDIVVSDESFNPSRLPHAEAFVKELLRAYPPVWIIKREAVQRTKVGEWVFNRGEHLILSPFVSHRDPRWWVDSPLRFIPERWLSDSTPCASHAFIPFGAGARMCIGFQFSFVELTVAVSCLASEYEFTLPNVNNSPMSPEPLLLPKGLAAHLRRRCG
ncbi:cytochrome P450 [Streptomyces sp. NBC_01619]|uniref:cytochrome P450 n=1 Tax=Streptomyces sp. NBC_01619 TaxID=2975901 RepID=UPI002250F567|nr:cytochrome P450 [Streptomyces sp. NBC_01619]MCX4515995.1 cytochrome P450 [Streptomyces sp. NBC_01619]